MSDREWLYGDWSIVDGYLLWLWFRAVGSGMDGSDFPRCADHAQRASSGQALPERWTVRSQRMRASWRRALCTRRCRRIRSAELPLRSLAPDPDERLAARPSPARTVRQAERGDANALSPQQGSSRASAQGARPRGRARPRAMRVTSARETLASTRCSSARRASRRRWFGTITRASARPAPVVATTARFVPDEKRAPRSVRRSLDHVIASVSRPRRHTWGSCKGAA